MEVSEPQYQSWGCRGKERFQNSWNRNRDLFQKSKRAKPKQSTPSLPRHGDTHF